MLNVPLLINLGTLIRERMLEGLPKIHLETKSDTAFLDIEPHAGINLAHMKFLLLELLVCCLACNYVNA